MTMAKPSILISSLFLSLFLLNSCGQSDPASTAMESDVKEETTSEKVTDAPPQKDRPRIVFSATALLPVMVWMSNILFPLLFSKDLIPLVIITKLSMQG